MPSPEIFPSPMSQRKGIRLLLLFILVWALASCASPHKVMVLYDRPGALQPGDRVIWEKQAIGSVGDFRTNPGGRTVVSLRIQPDYREALTDQSRFLIQSDPERPGKQSVGMILLASGGKPLPDGAVVEGSTYFSILTEKATRGAQGLPRILQDAMDRLGKELSRLSEQEWQKELESRIESWTRELERSGEEVRRYFRREVLPALERAVQDLLRRLKELGKEADGRSLEDKLERLKRSLR